MATIGHLAAGAVCGAVYSRATGARPASAVAAFAALAAAPDLDLLLIGFDTSATPLTHRTMTHSLSFAVATGALVGVLARTRARRRLLSVLAVLALASHGLLDALTRLGQGPRLLWPFTQTRFAFGWQPIPGTQSFQEYFTLAAAPVYAQEFVLHMPLFVVAALILLWGRRPVDPATVGVRARQLGAAEDPRPPDT